MIQKSNFNRLNQNHQTLLSKSARIREKFHSYPKSFRFSDPKVYQWLTALAKFAKISAFSKSRIDSDFTIHEIQVGLVHRVKID